MTPLNDSHLIADELARVVYDHTSRYDDPKQAWEDLWIIFAHAQRYDTDREAHAALRPLVEGAHADIMERRRELARLESARRLQASGKRRRKRLA